MRRGAGHRGGRGNAGVKKHRKSWYLAKNPSALVKKGRGRPDVPVTLPRAVNVRSLEAMSEELLARGIAERREGKIHVKLSTLGYDKLLGGGSVRNAWAITAKSCSKIAAEKVIEAGGEILPEGDSEASEESV